MGHWWQNIVRIENKVHPHAFVEQALRAVRNLDRYRRSQGRDFVVAQFFPIVFEHLRDLAFGCGRSVGAQDLAATASWDCIGASFFTMN